MTSDRVHALAEQAAHLLPEPPAPHDAFGYLAWEEIVLTTARRLYRAAGGDLPPNTAPIITLDLRSDRLTGSSLLALASLVRDADSTAGELALAQSLADRRYQRSGQRSAPDRTAGRGGLAHEHRELREHSLQRHLRRPGTAHAPFAARSHA